ITPPLGSSIGQPSESGVPDRAAPANPRYARVTCEASCQNNLQSAQRDFRNRCDLRDSDTRTRCVSEDSSLTHRVREVDDGRVTKQIMWRPSFQPRGLGTAGGMKAT